MKSKSPKLSDHRTAKMREGFLYLYRCIRDSWQWKRAKWLGAWVWLLVNARYSDGDGLKRGQLQASISYMAKAWGMTPKEVRYFLSQCIKHSDITLERGKGGRSNYANGIVEGIVEGKDRGTVLSTITLLNYETYQDMRLIEGIAEGTVLDYANGNNKKKRTEGKKEDVHASPSETVPVSDNGKPKKKPKKETDPRIKCLIDYYSDKHTEIEGRRPHIIGAPEATTIKRLLKTFTEDELQPMLVDFLNDPLAWADKPDWTLTLFEKTAGKYAHSETGTTARAKAEPPSCAAHRPLEREEP